MVSVGLEDGGLRPFDFAPLALRYAQDERDIKEISLLRFIPTTVNFPAAVHLTTVRPERSGAPAEPKSKGASYHPPNLQNINAGPA